MEACLAPDLMEYRRTLGTFATGITVITARGTQGEPIGVTANSFNSVSLDPPLILWSLAKAARSFAAFNSSEFWAVHILSEHQESLSRRFGKSGEDKFADIDVQVGVGNLPLLTGCSARLQCKSASKYEAGDHFIFVGEVLEFDRFGLPPLIFYGGRYAKLTGGSAARDQYNRCT
jgi:3-hydroxy-9,10-secoandrosta-1,3,5(10)-triene-9,17-dione monooxygenase reductase component